MIATAEWLDYFQASAIVWGGLAVAGALCTAFIGALSYRDRTKRQHAEWLESINTRVSTHPAFRRIRDEIAISRSETLGLIINKHLESINDGAVHLTAREREWLADLDDYLTYFEFLDYLVRNDHISMTEIEATLSWYPNDFPNHAALWNYIGKSFGPAEHLASNIRRRSAIRAFRRYERSRREEDKITCKKKAEDLVSIDPALKDALNYRMEAVSKGWLSRQRAKLAYEIPAIDQRRWVRFTQGPAVSIVRSPLKIYRWLRRQLSERLKQSD